MSVFEDTTELRHRAGKHDDVELVQGPASVETIHDAVDVWTESNEQHEGVLVADHPTVAEFDDGWIDRHDDVAMVGFEEFAPVDEMVTIVTQFGEPTALIVRPDAVRLDMEILDPDGVVVIEFTRDGGGSQ